MKKLLLALVLAPTLSLAATGDKALLPTAAQAALAITAQDNESKMLIFGYVAGIVQGLQVGKSICTPPGKTATQFNEEMVDVIIEGLLDPSVAKGNSLLVADISKVLMSRFPCSQRQTM